MEGKCGMGPSPGKGVLPTRGITRQELTADLIQDIGDVGEGAGMSSRSEVGCRDPGPCHRSQVDEGCLAFLQAEVHLESRLAESA